MRNAEPFAAPDPSLGHCVTQDALDGPSLPIALSAENTQSPETPDEFDAWYERNPDDGDRLTRDFVRNYPDEIWAAVMASPLAAKVYQEIANRISKGEAGA